MFILTSHSNQNNSVYGTPLWINVSAKWAAGGLSSVHCLASPGETLPLTLCLPLCLPQRPITTLCWGHRDSRLFLACGPALYVVRVEHRVAGLQLLCQQGIASALREEKDAAKLVIPARLCSYVTAAFAPTIKVQFISILFVQPVITITVSKGQIFMTYR